MLCCGIEERTVEIGRYIIKNNATIREAAEKYGICKSVVHKDMTIRLCTIDADLAKQVRNVLDKNKSERHIRGGMVTKEKYFLLSSQRNNK